MFSFKLRVSAIRELERIYANFTWNDKLHCWSWENLRLPKKEGGTGLRRVSDIVSALELD